MNLRQIRAYLEPLGRVVVDEHEGVEPQVQFAGQLLQVLRLGMPINAPSCHVVATQEHPGMPVQDIEDIAFLIPADQDHQDAILFQTQDDPLK